MRLAPLPIKTKQRNTNLASKLCQTKGLSEAGPLFDVRLEVFKLDIVPVDRHLVNVTIAATLVEELRHPWEAVGIRGGDRASEGITLVGKRPEVFIPNRDSSVGVRFGLTVFVDPGKGGLVQGHV